MKATRIALAALVAFLGLSLTACEEVGPSRFAGTYEGDLEEAHRSTARSLTAASSIGFFGPGGRTATLRASLTLSRSGSEWDAKMSVTGGDLEGRIHTFSARGTISESGRFSLSEREPACESPTELLDGMMVNGRTAVISWRGTADTCAGVTASGTLERT